MSKPYVAIVLTSKCNFRCPYCDSKGKGEGFASSRTTMEYRFFCEVIDSAYRLGVRRFRLTGGEPFLHSDIGRYVRYALSKPEVALTVDTNGSHLRDADGILSRPPNGFKVVVSLDTLRPERFAELSGSRTALIDVLDNVRRLAELGILKRINMVLTQINYDEVYDMIDFCSSIRIGLKFSDVARRHEQGRSHSEIYFDVQALYEELQNSAEDTGVHAYSRHFGSPMSRYKIRGCDVTLKHQKAGAHYAVKEVCGSCRYFPCDEGLYFVSALPDRTLVACQLCGFHNKKLESDLDGVLNTMIDTLESAEYLSAEEVERERANRRQH